MNFKRAGFAVTACVALSVVGCTSGSGELKGDDSRSTDSSTSVVENSSSGMQSTAEQQFQADQQQKLQQLQDSIQQEINRQQALQQQVPQYQEMPSQQQAGTPQYPEQTQPNQDWKSPARLECEREWAGKVDPAQLSMICTDVTRMHSGDSMTQGILRAGPNQHSWGGAQAEAHRNNVGNSINNYNNNVRLGNDTSQAIQDANSALNGQ